MSDSLPEVLPDELPPVSAKALTGMLKGLNKVLSNVVDEVWDDVEAGEEAIRTCNIIGENLGLARQRKLRLTGRDALTARIMETLEETSASGRRPRDTRPLHFPDR